MRLLSPKMVYPRNFDIKANLLFLTPILLWLSTWAPRSFAAGQQLTVQTPAVPQVNASKISIKYNQTVLVSYGHTQNICAVVTPAGLAPQLTFQSADTNVLSIQKGTDPSCNSGNGVYLTITSNMTDPDSGHSVCDSNGTIQALIGTTLINTDAGTVMIPTGEKSSVNPSPQYVSKPNGGVAAFLLLFSSSYAPPGVSANLDGVPVQEDVNLESATCSGGTSQTLNHDIGDGYPFDSLIDGNGAFGPKRTNCYLVFSQVLTAGGGDPDDPIGKCPLGTNTITDAFSPAGTLQVTRTDGANGPVKSPIIQGL